VEQVEHGSWSFPGFFAQDQKSADPARWRGAIGFAKKGFAPRRG
jgi:hypothetical protein